MNDDEPGATGSGLFHLALVAGVVPLLGLPIVALAAVVARRRAEPRWARRLAGLLALDVLVAGIVIAMSSGWLPTPVETLVASEDGPRIGVALDETYAGPGLRVEGVLPGSPAALAGIEAGDVIVGVEGAPVGSAEALRGRLGEREVALELLRDGEPVGVHVLPSRALEDAGRCAELRAGPLSPERGTLISYGVVLAGALLLAALGWKRGVRGGARTIVPFVVIPPLGALAGAGVARLACGAGQDALVLELALLGSEIVLVALAAGAVWLATRGWEGETPTLDGTAPAPVGRVVALGVLYVATWVPRVLFVALPLFALARSMGAEGGSEALGEVLGGDRAPLALAMTFVAGAVLAPIGEELLFRGLLVPWLARVVTPWAAIVVSALLFGALHEAHGMARIGPMTIGLVLGWARLRSGTLRAPIAIHALVNSAALTIAWLTD